MSEQVLNSSWVEPVLSQDKCVLLKDTTQCRRWGSNLQPLGLERSTLPLSQYAPYDLMAKLWWLQDNLPVPIVKLQHQRKHTITTVLTLKILLQMLYQQPEQL